jgi:precorrin-6B methylase 2
MADASPSPLLPGKIIAENKHLRLPRFPSLCTGLMNRAHDFYWERRLGVSTSGRRPVHFADAQRYEAVPYHLNFKLFERVGLGPEDVVVDLGSGEGRAVCAAALRPLAEVIGVEIDRDLHAAAERNVRQLRGRRAPIRLICGSATDFDFAGVTVLFLFNPFGPATMTQVLERLRVSLETNPREVRIVYVNAVCSHLFEATPWIELYEQWKMSTWSRIKTPVHFLRTI